METIRLRSKIPYDFEEKEYYSKTEADAEIARLKAAVKVAFDYISFMSDSDRDIIKQALSGGR